MVPDRGVLTRHVAVTRDPLLSLQLDHLPGQLRFRLIHMNHCRGVQTMVGSGSGPFVQLVNIDVANSEHVQELGHSVALDSVFLEIFGEGGDPSFHLFVALFRSS